MCVFTEQKDFSSLFHKKKKLRKDHLKKREENTVYSDTFEMIQRKEFY